MIAARLHLELGPFPLVVDFEAHQRVTGIFGPSGAGKSSLLECITGLRRPRGRLKAGEELWLDSDAGVFVPPESRGVGYVPQEGLLFPHLDVGRNLTAGAARKRRRGSLESAELRRICETFEIEDLLDRRVSGLSGGERQRVSLARAVASDPALLVLDEPLASLDVRLRRRILPFLRRLRERLEVPILYVSHDPFEIQALCDEMVAMRDGRIIAQGPPANVLADPEVGALSEELGFENVLAGCAGGDDEEGGRVDLGEGVILRTQLSGVPAGEPVWVGIPAQQILLAQEGPVGVSAQNVLPARVAAVDAAGGQRLARVTLGGAIEIAAEVTPRACEDLGLEPGRELFVVIKQTGCRVLGGEPPVE
ncbi:MAG: molybdenum ABC transporter ATP-binding protein [Acidobacteriota bacterium]|nr:molybdenum ABC transporter ATP-binding protein [Acidobacteriota bacterium]